MTALAVTGLEQIVRRPARHHRRQSRGRAGRAPADHRPERRRQDHAVQSHHRRAARPTAARSRCSTATSPRVPSRRRAHLGMARTYQIITLFPRDTILRNVIAGAARPVAAALESAGRRSTASGIWSTQARAALDARRPRPHRRPAAGARPPTAKSAASRSPWRWRKTRKCCCSTSRSPASRSTSAATCANCSIAIPRDVTIVMIEHDMDIALDFADRITLLHFGEVIVEGTRAEVVADPRTREVYLGE